MDKSFAELAAMKSGTILEDGYENGVRYIIMRGPCALCAYVGVPEGHPLAGKDYDDIPLGVHGGLTFAGRGDGRRPEGMYWYGWDYGHAGDVPFYAGAREPGKAWTTSDVREEIWGATYEFAKLMRLAERIAGKPSEED